MDIDGWEKKLDAILDKYGITENRAAIKDDIYYDIIQEAYEIGYEYGHSPKSFLIEESR